MVCTGTKKQQREPVWGPYQATRRRIRKHRTFRHHPPGVQAPIETTSKFRNPKLSHFDRSKN